MTKDMNLYFHPYFLENLATQPFDFKTVMAKSKLSLENNFTLNAEVFLDAANIPALCELINAQQEQIEDSSSSHNDAKSSQVSKKKQRKSLNYPKRIKPKTEFKYDDDEDELDDGEEQQNTQSKLKSPPKKSKTVIL